MARAQETERYEVQDDGDVSSRLKRRIIDARQRVDDTEHYLYVEAPVEENKHVNNVQQDIYWGMIVKQFLRTIGPILRTDDLNETADSTEYYEDVELGTLTLVPQDTEAVPFREYIQSGMTATQFRLRYGINDTADLPEPKGVEFTGLKEIMQSDGTVRESWSVVMEDGSLVQTQAEQAIPKQVYERAITEADDFLQQAGIGIEIDAEPHGFT